MPSRKVYYSVATHEMIMADIKNVTKKASEEFKIEEALIMAIIKTESGYNQYAIRYEPHLKHTTWYLNTLSTEEVKTNYAFCSMGLMQVLFGVAKHDGFKGTPHELLNVTNSIYYGTKHLRSLVKRFIFIDNVISAYNQGNVRKRGKHFRNQPYVNKVKKYYKKYGGKID